MTTNYIRLALAASLISLLLAACDRTPEPPATPDAPPTPDATTAPPQAPSSETIPPPSGDVPPGESEAEPAPSPPPDAPPPTEPSAVPKPTAMAGEPSLESMHTATPSAKISVPVDLRYSFDGEALPNQPVTLHLAAVPRVEGARLRVSVKAVEGLQVAAGPLEIQKTNATSAYRQQLSVTRGAAGPQNLRVLVTMDVAEGNGFGYFTIPLTGEVTAQKDKTTKQR